MNEGLIVDLPPEANDTRFTVYAPEGGLARQLEQLFRREITFVDLDVRHGLTYGTFRIYPGHRVMHHPRKGMYYVSDGYGTFLDKNGKEQNSYTAFSGSLWIEATRKGSPTGEITLWKRPFPEAHHFAS